MWHIYSSRKLLRRDVMDVELLRRRPSSLLKLDWNDACKSHWLPESWKFNSDGTDSRVLLSLSLDKRLRRTGGYVIKFRNRFLSSASAVSCRFKKASSERSSTFKKGNNQISNNCEQSMGIYRFQTLLWFITFTLHDSINDNRDKPGMLKREKFFICPASTDTDTWAACLLQLIL